MKLLALPPPIWVNLESTLGCNLECVMCGPYLSGVTKKRRVMDPSLVDRVERQVLPGARDLALTVAGEPFMTPKLRQFVELAERTGVSLQLNTNATLIKPGELLERLVRAASLITFSVDAADPEVYAGIRVKAELATVVANIRTVVALREALPAAERPVLAMACVWMQPNADQLPGLLELVAELGLDRLDVAHMTAFTPENEARSLRHVPERADALSAEAVRCADRLGVRVHLPPRFDGQPHAHRRRAKARLALRELRRIDRTRVRRLVREGRHRLAVRRWQRAAGGELACPFLRGKVMVSIGGDVAPCPMPGRPVAGNLLEQDFDAIWNGEVLRSMREGLVAGRPHACCRHCSQNPERYDPSDPATVRPTNRGW